MARGQTLEATNSLGWITSCRRVVGSFCCARRCRCTGPSRVVSFLNESISALSDT